MAEEKDGASARKGGAGALIRWLILLVGAVVAAALLALLLYMFVLKGMLSGEKPPAEPEPSIPVTATPVKFEQAIVSARKPASPAAPAALLLYTVTLLCSTPETAALVETHKSMFIDMLRELHSGHPREDLDDPMLRKNIQRQAVIKGNELLTRITGQENEQMRILEAYHDGFFIQDQ